MTTTQEETPVRSRSSFSNDRSDPSPHVVIVGAGFGGLWAAKALKDAPVRLTVVDRANHHLFQPLLYQVATAGLSPAEIATPIRRILSRQQNARVIMSEVKAVDAGRREISLEDRTVSYDYLVLATGSRHSYFGHGEWERLAPGLKSVEDAMVIRRNILSAFERAEMAQDDAERARELTFVIAGGGPTGVELAGALAELANKALAADFRRIDPRWAKIILLEAAPRILAGYPEDLARRAQRDLEKLGVEVRVHSSVTDVAADGVRAGSDFIGSKTVIWAAGVAASPVGKWLGMGTDRSGRAAVLPDLSVPGHPEIFVIGDAAHVPDESGAPLPAVAPVAMQEGTYVAHLIGRCVRGETQTEPFRYVDKGTLATIGRKSAIAVFGRLHLSGFLAWLLWLGVHIYYLIGFENRLLVMIQWAWAYITFQRGSRLITLKDYREVR